MKGVMHYGRNEAMEKLSVLVQENEPTSWHLLYPRRIIPPHGYYHPKYLSTSMMGWMMHAREASTDLVWSVLFQTGRKLLKLSLPTYFLGKEFIEDVAVSKIESDLKAEEMTWPEESMVFVLPTEFSLQYNQGLHVPFLCITHITAEELGTNPNYIIKEMRPDLANRKFGMVLVVFQYYSGEDATPVDYIWQYPDCMDFQEVTKMCGMHIVTTDFEQMLLDTGLESMIGMSDEEKEKQMVVRMHSLSLKIVLAMTAEPTFIDAGRCIHRKAKGGRERDDLWEPRTIGWKYRRPKPEGEGGGGWKLRFHRHPGYFRWRQHYGPGNSLVKTKWIQPYYVGKQLSKGESESPNQASQSKPQ